MRPSKLWAKPVVESGIVVNMVEGAVDLTELLIKVQKATKRRAHYRGDRPQSGQICTISAVPSTATRQESGNPNRQ